MGLKHKKSSPLVSVIILNYMGEKVIEKVIKSVLNSNFPKKQYEILVPDNNSKDKSKKILNQLAKKHSQINLLFLDKNYGFAGGNNRAISLAKGKYIVLLNNDCVVDKNWLKNLYLTAKTDPNIFSVSSKILLFPKYTSFHFEITDKNPLLEVSLTKSKLLNYSHTKPHVIPFIPTPQGYQINIPFESISDKTIQISLKFLRTDGKYPAKDILVNPNIPCKILSIKRKKQYWIVKLKIYLSKKTQKSFSKIQNAGNIIFQDGYGRDIGAKVKYMSQDYETDTGQFEKTREVYSSCGAACLYRKDILEKIGYLDENFFMYYEDIEICERARLAGYKVVYCPHATVRHLHALASREWSPFFVYNVEKGRLLHILYHFPAKIVVWEFFKFNTATFAKLFKSIKQRHYLSSVKINLQILSYFLLNLPKLTNKRLSLSKIYHKSERLKNYEKILTGYWYFN